VGGLEATAALLRGVNDLDPMAGGGHGFGLAIVLGRVDSEAAKDVGR
jgi:hypothetical protein